MQQPKCAEYIKASEHFGRKKYDQEMEKTDGLYSMKITHFWEILKCSKPIQEALEKESIERFEGKLEEMFRI